MNVWQELDAGAVPGSFTPPHYRLRADRDAPMACDVLGIFPIPLGELNTATRIGVASELLSGFFPRATKRAALSRGAPYYRISDSVQAVPQLRHAIRMLDHHACAEVPALRFAMVENLLNIIAATAYRLWESLTDQPELVPPSVQADLATILDSAIAIAADLVGSTRDDPACGVFLDSCSTMQGPFRSFRELDSQWKIAHEVGYLLEHVVEPEPDLRALVVPLYGSFALGLAAQAALSAAHPDRDIEVHFVRLGFHDLGHLDFFANGDRIDVVKTAPSGQLARLADRVAGSRVLVVDDNAGRGATMRAARTLVEQYGGRAITRSVETAWHLYHGSGRHDISAAVDLPSLRSNVHHTVHARLVRHLLRGDTAAYIADPAHTVRALLRQQMRDNLDLAHSVGCWSPAQLANMRTELAHATLAWHEPAVPRPPMPYERVA